jgi:hypothetical protein
MTQWLRFQELEVQVYCEVGDNDWIARKVELVAGKARAAWAMDEWAQEHQAGRRAQYEAVYGGLVGKSVVPGWETCPHDI